MKLDKIQKDAALLFQDMQNALVCGINLFLIDNVMTAYEINERTQYSDQSNFVQACKDFARDNNVHVIIVCHPTKAEGELTIDSTCGNLGKNDISGSGNISNKADNVISVERIWKDKSDKSDKPDAFITSLKDRDEGQRAMFVYYFSKTSLRFYNSTTPKYVNYDWEKYLPHQKALEGSPEVEWVTTNDAPF
jgi:twinkle protein